MRLFVSPPSWTTRKNRGSQPRTSIDLAAFLSVLLALVFTVMFGNLYPMHPRHAPVDMSVTQNSTLQPGARREDAIEVAIARDGTIFFRNHKILLTYVPEVLREAVQDGAEKTVYVKADARAKYGDVKAVLDQIRLSGLQNITFLTEHIP